MTLDLATLTLASGGHRSLDDGACLLEAASYLAGEPWSDHPTCVSPVLGTYGRGLNDVLPHDLRQTLKPYLPQLLNTAGDGQDERRCYLALDWLVRVYTPTWMRLVPALCDQAALLESAHEVVDLNTAAKMGIIVREAATQSAAARDAAWDAAGAAARDAAGAAARAAARAAAWDAAWAAARAAAWDAAWAAARAALAPTVIILQGSAIALFDRMIDPSA